MYWLETSSTDLRAENRFKVESADRWTFEDLTNYKTIYNRFRRSFHYATKFGGQGFYPLFT